MTNQTEKSEYDQEEDTYRIKSARARYCGLGIDVSGGLLKALPPLVVTNLAVILVLSQWLGRASDDEIPNIERLMGIANVSFWLFIIAFVAAAVLAWRLTPIQVRNERHAEWSDIKVRAIKTDALAALRDYKGAMPRVQLPTLRQGALDDSGKLDAQWVKPNWKIHSPISEKMQRNLTDLYPNLVGKMDNLSKLMAQYMKDFNTYSTAFQKEYDVHHGNKDGPKPQIVDNHAKGRIIGSYFWYSGEIQTLLDLSQTKPDIVQDDVTRKFLQEFISGDPSDNENVSSMQTREGLRDLAEVAHKAWRNALDEYGSIISIIDEIHRRGV